MCLAGIWGQETANSKCRLSPRTARTARCSAGCTCRETPDSVTVHANARFPVNKGGLCVKGWSAGDTLAHPDRLRQPLVRGGDGVLAQASWDEALQAIARRITDVQTRHGRDAVGVLGSGSLTNEKAYLIGKFARVALGTANVDYNGRFCMSTAAAAATRAFGIDRGLPFPLEDIARASVVMLVGANPAETMPPVMQYFEAQQAAGGALVVVDPRRTPTASWATRHLRPRPGSDAALANGLLHVLIRDGLIDERYVLERTEGFEMARGVAASCWPERVEHLTGVPEAALVETAHMLGRASSAMVHHGSRPGTAGTWRLEHPRLHQSGARAGSARQGIQRLRHAHGAG